MNFRNPKHNNNGSIDCEIEHPDYGWIPFTADPNDPEPLGKLVHDTIIADGVPIAAADPVPPPAEPLPVSTISKLQCKRQAVVEGIWNSLRTAINQDAEIKENWELTSGLTITEPDVIAMGAAIGKQGQDLQDFFNAAALL